MLVKLYLEREERSCPVEPKGTPDDDLCPDAVKNML
jgi:hypothetical protein